MLSGLDVSDHRIDHEIRSEINAFLGKDGRIGNEFKVDAVSAVIYQPALGRCIRIYLKVLGH